MSEIQKVGNESTARKLYEAFEKMPFAGGEMVAANIVRNICEDYTSKVEEVIEDKNEYVFDIENKTSEISTLEEEMRAKIEQLQVEIEALVQKKESGTITPEEEAQLEAKNAELDDVKASYSKSIETEKNDLEGLQALLKNDDNKRLIERGRDFGGVAVEKGQKLAETKDKRKSFWRKLFNTWDYSATRKVGEKLLEAGKNLLDKVKIASKK